MMKPSQAIQKHLANLDVTADPQPVSNPEDLFHEVPDPLGQRWQWLDQALALPRQVRPESLFGLALESVRDLPPTELASEAGSAIRQQVATRMAAGGTDEQIFVEWKKNGLVALCYSVGEEGRDVLDSLNDPNLLDHADKLEAVASFLRQHAFRNETTFEDLAIVVAALAKQPKG